MFSFLKRRKRQSYTGKGRIGTRVGPVRGDARNVTTNVSATDVSTVHVTSGSGWCHRSSDQSDASCGSSDGGDGGGGGGGGE